MALKSRDYSLSVVWSEAKHLIDKFQECLLIADDTVLDKSRSKKIELVN